MRRWVLWWKRIGGDRVPWTVEGVVSSVYLAPRHRVALSGKGEGVKLGINGGPLLAVCCGGPFPELCVVVQPRGVPKLFCCLDLICY